MSLLLTTSGSEAFVRRKLYKPSSSTTFVEYEFPLVNPGFETGDLTGWTQKYGTGSVATAAPTNGSTYYLKTNTTQWSEMVSDSMDIPTTAYTIVDAGNAKVDCVWSAYHSSTNIGYSYCHIYALDGDGNFLRGTHVKKQLNNGSWQQHTGYITLPPGARKIKVSIKVLGTGAYTPSTARVDDYTLTLRPKTTLDTNIAAETLWSSEPGNYADWTALTGALYTGITGWEQSTGTVDLTSNNGVACTAIRKIDIPAGWLADVAASNVHGRFVCVFGDRDSTSFNSDNMSFGIRFYDSGDTLLDEYIDDSNNTPTADELWVFDRTLKAPPTATKIAPFLEWRNGAGWNSTSAWNMWVGLEKPSINFDLTGSWTRAATSTSWVNSTMRQLVPVSAIQSGNYVRIFLYNAYTSSSMPLNMSKCYIQEAADVGNAYDFLTTPVPVTFNSGETSVVFDNGGGSALSDIIPLTITGTRPLIISCYFNSTTTLVAGSATNWVNYYKPGDDAATVDATAYSTAAHNAYLFSRIEIA